MEIEAVLNTVMVERKFLSFPHKIHKCTENVGSVIFFFCNMYVLTR